MKNGRTTPARKKWTFLFGILAVLGLGFCGYEFWQWVLPLWQTPSATGSFSVSSAPIGAVVRWKGRDLGHTPLKQCVLPSGDQVIEITMPGYQPCPIELTVRTGALVDLGVRSLLKQLGKLRLVTDPPGVSYLVVGPDKKTIAGVTPDTIENLPLGKYEVKLIEPGWPAFAQTADVNSSNPVEVNREFKGGSVELTSDPAGATIFIGGSKLGTAPLTANLPIGPVEVTSHFGTLVSVVQTLVPDAQRSVSFHFKHSYGTLLVSSDRADSVLIVDGVDYGHPPAQLFLAPGNHKLLLSAPSAPDKTRRVDLLEGQHVNVQINFGPMVGEVAAVSNANPSPTPGSSASVTSATPTSKLRPVQLAAQPTPTPTPPPASTTVPESNRTAESSSMPLPTAEKSASGSEEQPAIPPANVKASPSATPDEEQPKPVRTLTRSAAATKRLSSAVASTPSASPKPEPAKSKKEAFQVLDSHLKAKEEALNLEKQSIEYQIKNSSGSIREQWKYRLAQWRVRKARVEQDRAAEEARFNEQWK
ncbi:MAG: PEGA domain-containing protein [Verrucomicrobia bacterium]|nr:PEGA domain-containing protein [Verrucomicrobiota bacterium]